MAMVQAFVLIQAGVGMASRVGQAGGAIQGVRSTDIVTGPYDVVARVEAASIDALGRLVVSKIQTVGGIARTLTCPVVRLWLQPARGEPQPKHQIRSAYVSESVLSEPKRKPVGLRFVGLVLRFDSLVSLGQRPASTRVARLPVAGAP